MMLVPRITFQNLLNSALDCCNHGGLPARGMQGAPGLKHVVRKRDVRKNRKAILSGGNGKRLVHGCFRFCERPGAFNKRYVSREYVDDKPFRLSIQALHHDAVHATLLFIESSVRVCHRKSLSVVKNVKIRVLRV